VLWLVFRWPCCWSWRSTCGRWASPLRSSGRRGGGNAARCRRDPPGGDRGAILHRWSKACPKGRAWVIPAR